MTPEPPAASGCPPGVLSLQSGQARREKRACRVASACCRSGGLDVACREFGRHPVPVLGGAVGILHAVSARRRDWRRRSPSCGSRSGWTSSITRAIRSISGPPRRSYWPWLLKEIAKSAWDVTKRHPASAAADQPDAGALPADAADATSACATHANSITLTPGTITVEVGANEFLVHALTRAGAAGVAGGDMDRAGHRASRARADVRRRRRSRCWSPSRSRSCAPMLGPTVFDRAQAANTIGTCAMLLLAVHRLPHRPAGVPRPRDHLRPAQRHRHDRGAQVLPLRRSRRSRRRRTRRSGHEPGARHRQLGCCSSPAASSASSAASASCACPTSTRACTRPASPTRSAPGCCCSG